MTTTLREGQPAVKRLLVCGGRDYQDRARVALELANERPDIVITGGATGADALAADISRKSGIPTLIMPAPWERYGRSAGSVRNNWMLKFANPTHVLAFPGGSGTADMVKRAREAGLPVREVSEGACDFR